MHTKNEKEKLYKESWLRGNRELFYTGSSLRAAVPGSLITRINELPLPLQMQELKRSARQDKAGVPGKCSLEVLTTEECSACWVGNALSAHLEDFITGQSCSLTVVLCVGW